MTQTSNKTADSPKAKASQPKASQPDPLTHGPRIFADDTPGARPLPARAREVQHPALIGQPGVEVAERTIDHDTEPTTMHVKDFVTLVRDYDPEKDAVHKRNIVAVRQYMVNQGLRPDSDVVFVGETQLGGPAGRESVSLRYEVRAVPAVTAREFDQRHTVMDQDGPTPTERAEHDAKRVDRLLAARDAVRTGTPEAERGTA